MIEEYGALFGWLIGLSILVFVGSLLVVPMLVVRLPADYFATPARPHLAFADRHPVLRWTALVLKNILGGLLLVSGIAMLVLPGQGLLTIMIGVTLIDFPGKHALERRVVCWPPILRSINWLRRRSGVPPLELTKNDQAGRLAR